MDAYFFEVHQDLPREGPGGSESTRKAFDLVRPHLPEKPRILDIACGPGAQTLELARLSDGPITAIDTHAPFLRQLEKSAAQTRLAERIRIREMSMFKLSFEPGSFDLVWSEGAIFIIGFEDGLKTWRPLLAPGGCLAITEASWLRPDIPDELRAWWEGEYPDIRPVAVNLERIARQGWRLLGHFTLPASDWWDDYYAPIQGRLDMLRAKYAGNADAQAAFNLHELEIEMFRKYSAYYSYEFYVLQT